MISSGDTLTEVTVGCFDGDGNMVTGKTVYPNSKSYNIANVDAYILFDELTPGMYDYCVIATNSGGTQYLVWQSFAVFGNTATVEDGYYHIRFSGSDDYALTINGTNAELSAFDKGDDQAFLIQYQDNGYYSIYNPETGLYLDVENAASDYGTNVHAYSGNGSNAQRWQILPAGTNRWCMAPECASSLCLDVADGVFAQGQNVQLYGANMTNAQTLRLELCVPTITVSDNNVVLTMGETESATIEVGITGCFGDTGCNYVIAGGNVECAWGGATESGGALLTISAVTPGTSTVYVYLYDLDSGAVVVDTAVDVTVLQNDNSTLYYDANGGTQTVYSQPGGGAGTLTDVVIKDEIPTRFGYNFAGWADSPSATQPQFLPGDTISFYYDTTLYAVWVREWIQPSDFDAVQANILYPGVGVYYQYTPTVSTYYRLYGCDTLDNRVKLFEANGNLLASDDDNGLDRQFELQHYLQAGDTYFIYVDLYGSTTGSFYFAFVDGYAVIYHANGGSNAPASEILFRGTANSISSQVPSRTGYTFLGWATSSTATSAAYQPGDSFAISDDTTLYAVWKANTYAVSYNANGGSGAPSSQTKTHGTALTLSSTKPTRSGYTFLGWATSSTATSAAYQPGGSFTTNANTTLYAVWKANTYTVSYNANGGSGAPGSQTKTHGTTLTLSSTRPIRSGYTFLGWATSSTATSAAYQPGGSFTTNANTTLYAVWKQNPVADAKSGIHKAEDGNFYYYVDGKVAINFTGLADNAAGSWYILNGQVQTSYDGLITYEGTKYDIKAGMVSSYDGLKKMEGVWLYFDGGVNDVAFEGLSVKNGMACYVQNGEINFNKTDIIDDNGVLKYVKYGIFRNTLDGLVKGSDGVWRYVEDGVFTGTYEGLAKNAAGWWYIKDSLVDTTFTGLGRNHVGQWYVKWGQPQVSYTGTVTFDGVTYSIKNGLVQ